MGLYRPVTYGEMAEWFKAHAWKVCVLSKVPWVRIPLSPPRIKSKKIKILLTKKTTFYLNNKNQ